jgi:hypothetical protein
VPDPAWLRGLNAIRSIETPPVLRAPEPGEVAVPAAPAVQQSRRDFGPTEVLKTAPFWVMYVMFVMVGAIRKRKPG